MSSGSNNGHSFEKTSSCKKGDGINADGLEMYGGSLSISETASDGVDCSELIHIEGGTLDLNVAADDSKGLKCDSVIEITGGKVNAEVSGKGSKAVKAKGKVTVSGGELIAELSAKEPFAGTNNDYGYNAAIACDGDIEIAQEGKVKVTGAGIAAGAFARNGSKNSSAGGMGGKMSPTAVLVITDGKAKMVSVKAEDTISKIIDMVPEVVDKVASIRGKKTEEQIAVEEKIEEIGSKEEKIGE